MRIKLCFYFTAKYNAFGIKYELLFLTELVQKQKYIIIITIKVTLLSIKDIQNITEKQQFNFIKRNIHTSYTNI